MDELSDDERAALADTRRRAHQIGHDVGPRAAQVFLSRVLYDALRSGARPEFIAEIDEALEEYTLVSTRAGAVA